MRDVIINLVTTNQNNRSVTHPTNNYQLPTTNYQLPITQSPMPRSEGRPVGKECRTRYLPYLYNKNSTEQQIERLEQQQRTTNQYINQTTLLFNTLVKMPYIRHASQQTIGESEVED